MLWARWGCGTPPRSQLTRDYLAAQPCWAARYHEQKHSCLGCGQKRPQLLTSSKLMKNVSNIKFIAHTMFFMFIKWNVKLWPKKQDKTVSFYCETICWHDKNLPWKCVITGLFTFLWIDSFVVQSAVLDRWLHWHHTENWRFRYDWLYRANPGHHLRWASNGGGLNWPGWPKAGWK